MPKAPEATKPMACTCASGVRVSPCLRICRQRLVLDWEPWRTPSAASGFCRPATNSAAASSSRSWPNPTWRNRLDSAKTTSLAVEDIPDDHHLHIKALDLQGTRWRGACRLRLPGRATGLVVRKPARRACRTSPTPFRLRRGVHDFRCDAVRLLDALPKKVLLEGPGGWNRSRLQPKKPRR